MSKVTANQRIAALDAKLGLQAAQRAFGGSPYRVQPLGKHPHLRPTASGVSRRRGR